MVGYNLGDYIWHDIDGDGIQDFNEPGLEDVVVELYNKSDFLVSRTKTDQSGNYQFIDVFPSDYYIKVILTDNYSVTLFDRGGNDAIDSDLTEERGVGTSSLFTLSSENLTIDGGLIICAEIGGYVWFDYNENDIQDDFENGINQLRVELYRLQGPDWLLWDVTYSAHKPGSPSDDGYYKFCVPPGTYHVKFVNPPTTLVAAVPNRGFNENIDSDITGRYGPGTTDQIIVISEQVRCDVGAGYYIMGTIGDYVWYDDNNNGMREASEQGVEDVLVMAVDIEGNLAAYATTDANGQYMLDYLGKNSYYLQFDLPIGYSVTSANQGGDESMDSDVDGSHGLNTTKLT